MSNGSYKDFVPEEYEAFAVQSEVLQIVFEGLWIETSTHTDDRYIYISIRIYIWQKTTLYGCGFSSVSKITLFCLLGLTSTSITILWHKA